MIKTIKDCWFNLTTLIDKGSRKFHSWLSGVDWPEGMSHKDYLKLKKDHLNSLCFLEKIKFISKNAIKGLIVEIVIVTGVTICATTISYIKIKNKNNQEHSFNNQEHSFNNQEHSLIYVERLADLYMVNSMQSEETSFDEIESIFNTLIANPSKYPPQYPLTADQYTLPIPTKDSFLAGNSDDSEWY